MQAAICPQQRVGLEGHNGRTKSLGKTFSEFVKVVWASIRGWGSSGERKFQLVSDFGPKLAKDIVACVLRDRRNDPFRRNPDARSCSGFDRVLTRGESRLGRA